MPPKSDQKIPHSCITVLLFLLRYFANLGRCRQQIAKSLGGIPGERKQRLTFLAPAQMDVGRSIITQAHRDARWLAFWRPHLDLTYFHDGS